MPNAAGTPAGVVGRGLRVVWIGIRSEPWIFGVAVIGSALYGVGTAGGGWLLGRLTEQVLRPAFAAGRIEPAQLARVGLLLAAAAAVTALGVVARRMAAGITMFRLQARFRRAITRQYLRLPLAWHHRHATGMLLSVANADVEATWQVFAPLPMALGVMVMLLVGIIAMFLADPVLAIIGVLVLPTVLWANAAYQRRMSPAVMRAQQLRGEVSAIAHESLEAASVIKTLGREESETDRFGRSANRLRDANITAGRLRSAFDPVVDAVPTFGTLAVLAVGTWRVSTGAATPGDLVQVAYLLSLLSFPLRATGWVLGELPRTVVGWQRMALVLDAEGAMTHGDVRLTGTASAALSVQGLSHAYPADAAAPDGPAPRVLHDVHLDIPAGRTVALVGPTGSGKSTLAGLLVRLVDPDDGQVLLDGVDLRAVREGEVSGTAALVPQGTFVFHDTVRGNVALGEPGIDDARVWDALQRARVADVVRALPAGLDTVVGERGVTLSGGQRQRLALARALVRRPRLLVLDDATSAVDPRIEAEILAGLRSGGSSDGEPDSDANDHANGAGPGVTVLVVAHRTATIAAADEAIFLDDGRVTDRGTHAELLARSDGYRQLVTAYDRDPEPAR